MIKLEAFVLHQSDKEQDGKWYSLGVYEQRQGDHSVDIPYENAAEHFRLRAEYEYKRPVKMEPVSSED